MNPVERSLMRAFGNMPIRRKLVVIIMLATTAALLSAGIGIIFVDSLLFRAAMQRDLSALASIVADNSTAALAFDDPKAEAEILAALRARPHLIMACIYRLDGNVLASYMRPGAASACPSPDIRGEFQFTSADVTVRHPILLNQRRIGSLALVYDLGEISERSRLYGATVLVVLLASSLIAFLLSSGLRAVIAAPITDLVAATRAVAKARDYSIRARKQSGDELGVLVDAFNEMLARVQSRDNDLQQAGLLREEALREAQNARGFLETTLASIGDAVVVTDAGGHVIRTNRAALSLLRYSNDQVAGRPLDEVFRIVNEFTRDTDESPVAKLLREGGVVGLANHTVLIAGDGTEIPIDDSAAPIRQNGLTIGVVLVFRDVTERRRAERDAGYLAALVESSHDAILGKSPDGIIQTWNAGAERLYGYTAEEIIGRSVTELLPPGRRHEESDIVERLRHGQRVVHFETVRKRKNGELVDVSLTISPIRDKTGRMIGISHVARDITEQKKNAEKMRETQKLESLGILAGGIAHDFNNLLVGILGNASLAQDMAEPGSPVKPLLEDVIGASERAAQLTRQMLAYSGKGRFVLERIDLSALVRDTVPLIQAAMPSTVELRLELEESLPAIEADVAQIQQLTMNIVINGAEAIPEGTPGTVTIRTRRQTVNEQYLHALNPAPVGELKPGTYVLFEVADTGVGMDEATKARIFDPFFTTKFTGRGLGLAAAIGIVRGHAGAIRVSSTPGQGTVFRVLLPALQSPLEQKPPEQPREIADLTGCGPVLVIDDEEIVRKMAQQTLERYDCEVLLADNGATGLEVFRREAGRIRCVVLDLTMPQMSGEETLERLRALRPDIPVILSSGFSEMEAIRRFAGKGLAGFLQKPYKPSDLAEEVREVIRRAQRA